MEPNSEKDKNLVHSFNPSSSSFFSGKLILFLIIAAVLGITSGYFLTKSSVTVNNMKNSITASTVSKGTIDGSSDTKTFKDTTEGVLKEGGIKGEGAFHLERPGGESQNVYLTSSIVDLSKYLNRKLKVWGETQKAQHAGWLMDVGRIEVAE